MKLIIQIPCYNEAESIQKTIQQLPRKIEGIRKIEILVIDDGSQDASITAARSSGPVRILALKRHLGLARAYAAGLEESIRLNADIIVNTDADNQYPAAEIKSLIQPILKGEADLVLGDRDVLRVKRFTPLKRFLQKVGSTVVGWAAGVKIPDASSGFRAMTRETALRTNVLSNYTYTLETLIQAGANRIRIAHIPIKSNPTTRPSRLMKGTADYLLYSGATIIRAFTMYRPLRVFSIISAMFVLSGLALGGRFLYYYFSGSGAGHIQSVILSAVLLIIGFQTFLIGLVADLISANRKLSEEILYRMKKDEKNTQ